jgi:hypothetical protein
MRDAEFREVEPTDRSLARRSAVDRAARSVPPEADGRTGALAALQRAAGNAAVAQLMARRPPARLPAVQRLVSSEPPQVNRAGTSAVASPSAATEGPIAETAAANAPARPHPAAEEPDVAPDTLQGESAGVSDNAQEDSDSGGESSAQVTGPSAAQLAQQIEADAEQGEQQINTVAGARRREISNRFGGIRGRVALLLASAGAEIQAFLSARRAEVQASSDAVVTNGKALVAKAMQAAQGQVAQARTTVNGLAQAATADLGAQATQATGRITGMVEGISLPDLPGISSIKSATRALASKVGAAVQAGVGRAGALVRAAVERGAGLLGSVLAAAGQAVSSVLTRLAATVGQMVRAVLASLSGLGTAVLQRLRSAVHDTVLPAVDRAESTLSANLTAAHRQAIAAIRSNRRQHLQAVQDGGAAADGGSDLVSQARQNTSSVATVFRERTADVLGSAENAMASGAAALSEHFGMLVSRIADLVQAPLAKMTAQLRQARDAVSDFAQSLLSHLTAAADQVVGFVRSAVREPLDMLARFAGGAASRIGQFFSGLADQLLRGNFSLPKASELIGDPRMSGGPIDKPEPRGPITKPLPDLALIALLAFGALVVVHVPQFAALVGLVLGALGIVVGEVVFVVIVAVAALIAIAVVLILLYLLIKLLKPRPKPRPKITHTAHSSAPDGSPDDRAEVAVAEGVDFQGSAEGVWTANAGSPRTGTGSDFTWFAPSRRRTVTIKLKVGSRVAVAKLRVVEPQNIEGIFKERLTYPRGEVGAGMKLDFAFHPLRVFFGNIQHKEDPTPAVAVRGYYRKFSEDDLKHKVDDRWHDVGDDNRGVKSDEASQHGADLTPPYIPGSYHWKIPNKFRLEKNDEAGKEFTVIKQEFGMEAGGKASVDKLGQHVERDPSEA